MPRYERPKTSVIADFGEHETAAMWGVEDDLADIRIDEARLHGVYPPAPRPGQVRGYSENPEFPVVGELEIGKKLRIAQTPSISELAPSQDEVGSAIKAKLGGWTMNVRQQEIAEKFSDEEFEAIAANIAKKRREQPAEE